MRLLKAIIAGCLFAAAACSFADGYPSRPIRFIVPFSAGGLGDVTARPLAKELGQQLGQPVVVENKPGANTTLGLGLVAHAPADGYTLVLGTEAGLSNAPNIWPHLPYDPIRDFIPIAIVTSASQVLVVNAKSPIRNLHDLVAEARRRPGGIPYGSLGLGSTAHIAMEELGRRVEFPRIHVPYQGVAPALTDLAGGQIETMFAAVSVPLPLIKQGQLRAIAYSGDSRNPLLPDVPTFIELGLTGFTSKGFQGIFVPRGTPPEVVAKLRTTVQAIVSSASFQKNVIAANGFEPPNVSPTELESFVTSHLTASKALIDPIRGQFDLK